MLAFTLKLSKNCFEGISFFEEIGVLLGNRQSMRIATNNLVKTSLARHQVKNA